MKKNIEYLLFRIFRFIILILPLKSAQTLGKSLGGISCFLLSSRHKITVDNLKNAFPEKSNSEINKITKHVFENLGISICELLWFPNLNDEVLSKLLQFINLELLIDEYKKGKGVIFLSGHFANWELTALGTGYGVKSPMTIIAKRQSNIKVDKIITEHRTMFGNIIVTMEQSVREILTALNKGGYVAMLADQSAPKESIFVNFFGREVATFQGPALFALRTRAPMYMGLTIRKPDMSYELILEEIDYSDLTEYNEQCVLELTQRHTAVLEKYIRMYPDQWMWTHRRWKNVKNQ